MTVQSDISEAAAPAQATLGGLTLAAWRKLWLSVGIVVALVFPLLLADFEVFQLTQAMIYAIAILGLNLLTGFNGQFSLGHSAFFAIGAYTAAIMMDQWAVPYYWTIIPAGAACFVAGFLFGLPALRLEGLYLALATFALAVAMPQILKYEPLEHWTGGVQGIDLDKPVAPFGMSVPADPEFPDAVFMSDDQWLYYFTLMVGVVMYICAWNLVRGRPGRAMIAIRDNPIAAKTMGVNTAIYKSVTFGVSALYTGVAGALGAIVIQFVAPDSFTFILAVSLLVGLVIGGVASIPFTIFGGLFILYVPNWANAISDGLAWAVYGVMLILAVYVMPTGAAGLLRLIVTKLMRLEARRGAGD